MSALTAICEERAASWHDDRYHRQQTRSAGNGGRIGRRRLRAHIIAIAKRSLIKMARTPEALIDVTLQPIIFLVMFTYIFGGAIAGGSQSDYLQFLLPGLLGQSIAMAGWRSARI